MQKHFFNARAQRDTSNTLPYAYWCTFLILQILHRIRFCFVERAFNYLTMGFGSPARAISFDLVFAFAAAVFARSTVLTFPGRQIIDLKANSVVI